MAATDERVNDLVDRLETGRITHSAFLEALNLQSLVDQGIGGLVAKRARAPTAPLRPLKDLQRTGVVLKISRRVGTDNNVHGYVRPGALDLTETFIHGTRKFSVVSGA